VLKFSVKGSKLLVIFILTVIVSGSILTYLSISNISNYRELLEKKVSEEQAEVTKNFAIGFQNNFQSLTLKCSDYVQNDSLQPINDLKDIPSNHGFINYVVLDHKGVFIKPYFMNAGFSLAPLTASKRYSEKLRLAVNHEFVVKDFKRAETFYFETLRAAVRASDSAHIYNAMARLYLKMNRPQKAFEIYQIILSDFKNTTNASGFPYVYFSIIKLLKMEEPSKDEAMQQLLLSFLNGLAEGSILLNESTEELLDNILTWQDSFQERANSKQIETLIALNKRKLELVNAYKSPIEALINNKLNTSSQAENTDFIILKPGSGDTNELMLFFKGPNKSMGFIIGLQAIFSSVIGAGFGPITKFEYELSLVEKTGTNFFSTTGLITQNEFSPHFEDSLVRVSLKNKEVINEMVFKRKVIYGLGLIIFLGIMVFGLYLLKQDLQREMRMNKLRADFVSNVTHELKTPLTSIYMFAEALHMKQDNADIKQKKYTNIILKESEKLKRMINNILEFSRTENDKLSYNLELTNLTDIVNASIVEMNYFLEINNFELHLDLEDNVFAAVDPEGIKQALSNLVSNAIKYSPTHKKLNIVLFKRDDKIYIEVEDFGKGIPKDKLELIFEKFYRVNATENETISGTGLGLTVTKAIIEKQNGKLLVESRLGEGSTFTIVLNTM